jgi:hypothetical protein
MLHTDRIAVYFRRAVFAGALLVLVVCNAAAQRVHLRAQLAPNCTSSIGNNLRYADIFGDGNIAVLGSYGCRGAFIFDITNPDAPVLASWYNPGNSQQFLEAIVMGNIAYFGSGSGQGGVHIVDVSNPYAPVLLGTVDSTHGNGNNYIHEMIVFDQGGSRFLIENYNSLGTRPLKIINVTNPAAPVFVWSMIPTEPQWVHAMVVRGNRLFTSGWGNSSSRGRTEIYDIQNLGTQQPTLLGYIEDTISITHGNNMHSAWPSEDGNWLYSCRETNNGDGDVRVYDIRNPATPLQVNRISMQALHLNAVSPHNPVVAGNYLFVSWYQAGLQVFNISNPANPVRVGQYDTFGPAFAPSPQEKQKLLQAEPWDMICGAEAIQNGLPTSYDGDWAVYPFLGLNKVLVGDLASGLFVLDASRVSSVTRYPVISDFDGDRITDVSVYTNATGDWQMETSSDGQLSTQHYGQPGDVMVSADYDGDGVSDVAVFRPSEGNWYIQGSSFGERTIQFGQSGDVPVAADYDADGRTDIAVWRPSTGVWYIQQSTLGLKAAQWGMQGDKVLTGDYEGDGKADLAVWRPSTGMWYILPSSSSIPIYQQFGQTDDKPLGADFDGDGIFDFVVYRPSTGVWYIMNPSTSETRAFNFGIAEDIPVPSDYDGDAIADLAVFRASTATWYRINSSTGEFVARQFGQTGDAPSPASIQPH